MTIDIDSLTIGDLKKLAPLVGQFLENSSAPLLAPPEHPYPFKPGDIVCVQTVTLWYVGTLAALTPLDIILQDAAWAADTGRFSDFVKIGDAKEVEPFPDGKVAISRGAVILVSLHPKQLRVLK